MLVDIIQPLALKTPVMTKEKFADESGLTHDTVRGLIEKKSIPVIRIGKRALINLASLAWVDTPTLNVPVVTKERFAETSGLTENSIETQYYEGHLPGKKIGRHVMIDIAALTRQCMSQA